MKKKTSLLSRKKIDDLLSFQFDCKLKPSNTVGVPQIHGCSDGGEEAMVQSSSYGGYLLAETIIVLQS